MNKQMQVCTAIKNEWGRSQKGVMGTCGISSGGCQYCDVLCVLTTHCYGGSYGTCFLTCTVVVTDIQTDRQMKYYKPRAHMCRELIRCWGQPGAVGYMSNIVHMLLLSWQRTWNFQYKRLHVVWGSFTCSVGLIHIHTYNRYISPDGVAWTWRANAWGIM